jgi:putative ABC transport system permease protein
MNLEALRVAVRVLRARKMRSALTVLSIAVGACSIVVMSSLARSGQATLARGLEELGGARLIDIGAKPPERAEGKAANYFEGLGERDRDLVFNAAPHVVDRAMFAVLSPSRELAADSGVVYHADLVGGDGGMLALFRMRVARGRGFSEEENRAHAKVCVVGDKTAKTLWAGGVALDHWLTIDGLRCRVIGQLADDDRFGVNFGFDAHEVVVVPFDALAAVDGETLRRAELLLKTDDASHNEIVKRIVNHLLVARHHGVDDFQIFDFRTMVDKFNSMFSIMEAVVACIAAIALLVGGFGVMNMMLVSVSERVREIGIRKAVGASPRDIGTQFLCEAIVLSGGGGAVGALAGVLLSLLAAAAIRMATPSWVPMLSASALAWAVGASSAIGVVFGWLPARAGARLPAIEAMRR